MLNLEIRRFQHAVLLFDFEGSGTELSDALSLEQRLDCSLAATWDGRAKAIVIEPEVDVWLWGSDNAMQQVLG